MQYDFTCCTLCPRSCGVNRTVHSGVCGCKDTVVLSKVMHHYWEEPCLAPDGNPSGAVFFAGCPMKCIYCQNFEISQQIKGYEISIDKLATVFSDLANSCVANIDLVTPTHFTPQIAEAFEISGRFPIPVIYNTSGYETAENIVRAKTFSDVYLCDMRYLDNKAAKKYSNAPDYPEYAKESLEKAVRLFGTPKFDMSKLVGGVIVRVLVIPGRIIEAKMIISYLAERYGKDIIISIMGQYTPMSKYLPDELSRRLTKREYETVIDFAANKDITAYMQEDGSADDSFVPDWSVPGFEI